MSDHPIIFSGPMVRAILDGRKTQTRRVVKPQPYQIETSWLRPVPGEWWKHLRPRLPYGIPGDRLWVRETWAEYVDVESGVHDDERFCYRATDKMMLPVKWRPSIHMPRWASRITLEVTGVRVERLQEISEADARVEGVGRDTNPCDHVRQSCADIGCLGPTHRASFCELWDTLNAKRGYSWESNPWVWVVEFKLVKTNA